jgi:hypothetical protein
MRSLILMLVVTSLTDGSFAQKLGKNHADVEFSFGGGVYGTYDNFGGRRKVGAAPMVIGLNADFFVADRFSIGADARFYQRFLGEVDTLGGTRATNGGTVSLQARYHLVSRKRFNLYVGSGAGVAGLEHQRTDSLNNVGYVQFGGTTVNLHSGFRIHFTPWLGLHFRAMYSIHSFGIRSFVINGLDQAYLEDKRTDEVLLSMRGAEVVLGLTFAF